MPTGPGKYDDLCTIVREQSEATAAIVIILDGNRGTGFSVQATYRVHPEFLATTLEHVAKTIRESGA